AVDEVVEHGDLFGQAEGLPDGENDRHRADLETPGPLTDVQGLEERGGRGSVVGEMVFGNQAIIKAHSLGILDRLHPFSKQCLPRSEGGIWPLIEQSKLHRALPSRLEEAAPLLHGTEPTSNRRRRPPRIPVEQAQRPPGQRKVVEEPKIHARLLSEISMLYRGEELYTSHHGRWPPS